MKIQRMLMTTMLAAWCGVGVAAAQHEGHQAPGATGVTGSSDATDAAACVQVQAGLATGLDAMQQRLETARLSNSAATMRAAIGETQSALLDVRRLLAPCQPTPVTAPNAGAPAPAGAGAADPHAGHTANVTASQTPSQAPLIKDPKCVETVDPRVAPQATHGAQTYYFCTERARQLFLADPTAYLSPAAGAAASSATRRAPTPPVRPATPSPAVVSAPATSIEVGGSPNLTLLPPPVSSVDALKCAGAVDPRTAPRVLHQGRMYYFCSEQERAVFIKEPAKYRLETTPAATPQHAH